MTSPPILAPLAKSEAEMSAASDASFSWPKRLWGGALVVVGYLLSPLCWWNDLVINLPLALGFGYLARCPGAHDRSGLLAD